MQFLFDNKIITEEILNQCFWLKTLYLTRENHINPERTDQMAKLKQENLVLRYVERSIQYLHIHTELSAKEYALVERTLQYSEIAKGGMPEQRRQWSDEGLTPEIHNEASAQLYLNYQNEDNDSDFIKCVYILIKTHGLLGQYIRGENSFSIQKPLYELLEQNLLRKDELKRILIALNHCVIAAANENIWIKNENEIKRLVNIICDGKLSGEEKSTEERLRLLFPVFRQNSISIEEKNLFRPIFDRCDLWYSEAALESFSKDEIVTIFSLIGERLDKGIPIRHISFYPLAQNLLYDYKGKKKINVYKKRICEFCLRELHKSKEDTGFKEHVSVCITNSNDTLYFDFSFTKVCAALINFCEEAEVSGMISYEKNIQVIYDLFGFRRDIFDRLNNEEIYLQTMNDGQDSSKASLLNYVKGNTIVDVGSGGGILLDLLEKQYPDKTIIGTDIADNVIENLNHKIENEKHHYRVICHNFVEKPLNEFADCILFSSILHEIFSYSEYEGEKFRIESVHKALENAVKSLNKHGRIIIRDGIRTKSERVSSVLFKEEKGVSFCRNYLADFKGLAEYRNKSSPALWDDEKISLKDNILFAKEDFLREALYTYTWGSDSYAQEVQEQFGYFTLNEYREVLENLGLKVLVSRSFTEPGYPQHLDPLVDLCEPLTWDDLPSTCILVAEKPD